MSFLKSGSAVTRFKSPEFVPTKEALSAFSFKEIEDSAEELSIGWTSIEDVDDFNFELAPVEKGSLYAWTLRIDKRSVKASTLRKLAIKKIKEELEQEGKEFLSKARKNEIKEQIKLQLLSRTVPDTKTFDVVYVPKQNRLYFSSVNKKMIELFLELFERTFNLELERLTPFWTAKELIGSRANDIFECQMDAYDACPDNRIPAIFLSWLWKQSEADKPVDGTTVLASNKVIFYRSDNGILEECAVSGDENARLPEAKTALADGKNVRSASFFVSDELEWTAKVTADFDFTVKLPKTEANPKNNGFDGFLMEKIYLFENFFQVWDKMYQFFLESWTPEIEAEIRNFE